MAPWARSFLLCFWKQKLMVLDKNVFLVFPFKNSKGRALSEQQKVPDVACAAPSRLSVL
jgi:hypothetical protein